MDKGFCYISMNIQKVQALNNTLSNCGPNSSKDGATTTLSRSWRRSLVHCKKEFSAATLGTGMQYKLKQ